MNGIDFLNFAKTLHNSADEAARRSSVSRSYYAIYHQMKEILTSIGIHVGREPSEHQRLARYLKEGGKTAGVTGDAGRYGQILEDLREARNEADYDLSLTKFNPMTCQWNWKLAETMYNAIDTNIVKYKKSFTDYAKKINELPP